MPSSAENELARSAVISHARRIKGLPSFHEPTKAEYALYTQRLLKERARNHTVDRGKRQISVDLGMTMSTFEALFIGKSILDVGCGTGILSSELARLKKTKVTALDNDPELLGRVKESRNLKAVLGSGYDLTQAVGDEHFDVVISSFSSFYWAKNEVEKRASVQSPLSVCNPSGGRAIFVPFIFEPGLRDRNRQVLSCGGIPGSDRLSTAEREELKATISVGDWLDVVSTELLLGQEQSGAINCTFQPSRDNARNLSISGTGAYLERYSVIAQVH